MYKIENHNYAMFNTFNNVSSLDILRLCALKESFFANTPFPIFTYLKGL